MDVVMQLADTDHGDGPRAASWRKGTPAEIRAERGRAAGLSRRADAGAPATSTASTATCRCCATCRSTRRSRRGALPARTQRRRQDHDAEGHHGARARRAPAASLLDGVDLTALPAHDVPKQGIAYVPQGRRLFAELTVRENLEIGLMTRGTGQGGARPVLASLPGACASGFASAPARSPAASSRCSPWRARSASSRRCMLLDEPTEGLMPSMIATIRDSVRELKRQGVAHHPGRAAGRRGAAGRRPRRLPRDGPRARGRRRRRAARRSLAAPPLCRGRATERRSSTARHLRQRRRRRRASAFSAAASDPLRSMAREASITTLA